MGCGPPSKPTSPEPVSSSPTKVDKGATADSKSSSQQHGDSFRSNGSSKQRKPKKPQPSSATSSTASKETASSPTQQSKNGATAGAGAGAGAGVQRKVVDSNGTAAHNHHHPHPHPSGSGDPHWIQLWEAHQSLILDPADVHSTIEEFMARGTNKLSATEIMFLLRKIRAIVRSSTSQDNISSRKGSAMMGRILSSAGNSSSNNNSQVQETKAIAERFHLLSNHVVRRLLPKPPPPPNGNGSGSGSGSNAVNPADSVFLLLVYMHESLWDRTAEIAAAGAKAAGLEMDVNKHKPLAVPPEPTSPNTAPIFSQDLPPGVSFHALTFLIGLALRKYSVIIL
jgi:hypothetical protein